MKNLYLIFLFAVIATPNASMFSQDGPWPQEFNFPCPPEEIPLDVVSSTALFTILNFDGQLLNDGDFVVATNTDGQVIGRDVVFNQETCDGRFESTITLAVYEDNSDGTCTNGWGAMDGEIVTLSILHEGVFYDIPYEFTFPTDNNIGIDPPNGDFCLPADFDLGDVSTRFLPASILSFRGHGTSAKSVELLWEVATEENVSHYEVQRSQHGESWEAIGTVSAHGNSRTPLTYGFEDRLPLGERQLYRLRIVDADDTYEHSGIVIVTINDTGDRQVTLFPNPVTANGNQLSIQLRGQWDEDQPISAQLFDAQGRALSTYPNLRPGTSAVALPAGTAAGLYLLRTTQGNVTINQKLAIR